MSKNAILKKPIFSLEPLWAFPRQLKWRIWSMVSSTLTYRTLLASSGGSRMRRPILPRVLQAKLLLLLPRGEYGTHHQRKFWLYLGIARWGGVLSFKPILFNQVSHSSCNIDSSGKAFQCSRVDYGGKAEQIVSRICWQVSFPPRGSLVRDLQAWLAVKTLLYDAM